MGRIFLGIAVLLVLAVVALIGYAYLADLTPATTEQRQPVTLPGVPGSAPGTDAAAGTADGN